MRSRSEFQHCLKKAPECGSETRIARRSVKKQLLTKIMMGKRLLWAKKYQNWTEEDWQKVMFSDESNFFVRRHRSQHVRCSPEPKTKKSKKQAEEPAVYVDPPDKVKNAKGKPATLKITSWNVDGLRAWVKKNALEWVTKDSPDILCLQEVKCSAENVPAAVRDLGDFPHQFWSTGVREGLHGVGLLCKEKPLKVTYGINMKEFDEEGRAITAEFDSFILVMAYVPNSGRGLVRLDDRERWDETFCKHLKGLQEDKPLVVCGDFNVAYEEIDLKNPKSNKDRTPGFTQRERDGFRRLLDIGLVDSFRKLYPDVQYAYTFWTYMMNARAKNVGWRLDYFLLSNDLMSALCDSKIRSDVRGSDHCPISLRLAM